LYEYQDSTTSKVYLVGAGPGDPELLTLRAAKILAMADVVIYDRLVSAEILALANAEARFVYVGKQQGDQDRIQEEISKHLLHFAARYKTVVRLKGGDPMVFARGAEEWLLLRENGYDVEVIPGISSAVAGPTQAGIPLTLRGVAASFTVVAGHRQSIMETNWADLAKVDTIVVLMGVENRELIAESLIQQGRPLDQPVAFIERATTERRRVVTGTLEEMAKGRLQVESPAVLVIGEVVRMRQQLLDAPPARIREEIAVRQDLKV
jgi:uroporphyrin-III C-methyltransferase